LERKRYYVIGLTAFTTTWSEQYRYIIDFRT